MTKKPLYAMLLTVVLIGSFLVGARYGRYQSVGQDDGAGRRILYYVDPMNPSHTSDKPGLAPCGMKLEPVYADEEATGKGSDRSPAPISLGAVKISPQKQQMMAVQVGTVEMTSETLPVRTLGKVAVDENLTYRILAGEDGWMWNVREGTTGSLVQKDQLLGSSYNYLFLARQQQYLYALDTVDRRRQQQQRQQGGAQPPAVPSTGEADEANSMKQSETHPVPPPTPGLQKQQVTVPLSSIDMVQTNVGGVNPAGGTYYINDPLEIAKLELFNLGVTEFQMNEVARTRQIAKDLEIRSPVSGIVLARNVSAMQRFNKGSELFRIADLSRVWIMADVYSREAPYITPGARAKVTLPEEGRVFEAVVTNVPSQFDPVTRSLKVRLEAVNPDIALRPDMFVYVEFLVTFPPALTAPVDAVLDSGIRKTVFVDLGNGYFEPREVKTGWRFGDRVEIKEGLHPSERIVVSGNFLIDSESRMKLAASGMFGSPAKDPVCGMEVYTGKAKAAGLVTESDGQTYYFCSVECKDQFHNGHEHPAQASAHREMPMQSGMAGEASAPHRDSPAEHGFSKCPVCGMIVSDSKAKTAGLAIEHEGKTFHLCSGECKIEFGKAPERYTGGAPRNEMRHAVRMQGGQRND